MDKFTKILIVDDDSIVTSSLKTLLQLEDFDDAVFFNSPIEALEYLKTNKPALIVSDFLMPDMNGIEFLLKSNELYPDISKILLTGYADKESAIKAINEVGIYKYIEKPWDNDDLIINIRNALERTELITKLKEKVDELEIVNNHLEKYSSKLEEMVAERTVDLVEVNNKLSAIINFCADGIIAINSKGVIEEVNPAIEKMLGLDKQFLVNNPFDDFLIGPFKITKYLKEEKEVFIRDFVLKTKNKNIPVEISLAPIISPHSKPDRFVIVIRDITVQKEAERLRDDFIATLTHDLRTPLLAAIQTLRFFLDGSLGDLTEKQKMLLDVMKNSNEDMLGLVNALLEVYKYEAGKLSLCKINFSLNTLINQCISEFTPLVEAKHIQLHSNLNKLKEINICADRNELRRVILNLFGNAIQHTQEKGDIEIKLEKKGDDITFKIKDSGSGISEEDISKLFKRFSQGTSQKRSCGTGLGLYLSRQIIEAHNGKIWVESEIGKGSVFAFQLYDIISKKEKVLSNE